MKIRSKPLYEYLLQANVLDGPDEAIRRAKQAYRKSYKRQWKQRSRPVKEIRYTVTIKQFVAIKKTANEAGLRHTTYAKAVALESIGLPRLHNDALLEVLQFVSMAVIATERHQPYTQVCDLLHKAETRLLEYLRV